MDIISHTITVFLGFFAIMNPIANTPIFLGLTEGESTEEKKKIAYFSVLIAFLIVVFFSILGKVIFELFGISLSAFRITGGILVFIIGFQMLHGEHSRVHMPKKIHEGENFESDLNIAISPLAMPILAGPGTISTAMNYSAKGNFLNVIITIVCFAILCGITYILFVSGEKFVKYLGSGAIKVITRLMGLILAVIGTQMVIDGILEVLKYKF